MKLFLTSTYLIALLGLHSCSTVPTPPAPANVPHAPALEMSNLEFKGKIAANVASSLYAAQTLPESNEKQAIIGPLKVAASLAGEPSEKDRAEAMAPVMLALAGKLTEAQAGWARATTEAAALKERITQLEQTVKDERTAAAAELTRQLQAARDEARREAEAKTRTIVSWIFFGGSFLLGVAAVLCLVYAGSVPQLGPRAAIGFGGASAVAAATGVGVLQLISHPSVMWWGMGITVGLAVIACVIIYINHLHHIETLTPAKP